MIVNHINLPKKGKVYCHRLRQVADLTREHYDTQCSGCPYFNGTAQGEGVECRYEDAGDPILWAKTLPPTPEELQMALRKLRGG